MNKNGIGISKKIPLEYVDAHNLFILQCFMSNANEFFVEREEDKQLIENFKTLSSSEQQAEIDNLFKLVYSD